jgi:hypothetical protein
VALARICRAAPRQKQFTAKSPFCKPLSRQGYDKMDCSL